MIVVCVCVVMPSFVQAQSPPMPEPVTPNPVTPAPARPLPPKETKPEPNPTPKERTHVLKKESKPSEDTSAPKTTVLKKKEKQQHNAHQTAFGAIVSTFTFGSYARVRAATDLQGGVAKQVNVVTRGSRIDEHNYAELEFQQRFELPKSADTTLYAQAVSTLALGGDFFHFTGDFDQTIALRNLYGDFGLRRKRLTLSAWAGSRMYRGDDVYLLDFWPLDNLNTVGGGIAGSYDWSFGRSELKIHVGGNRLFNSYQFQQVQVPGFDFGATDVVFLNRQRVISSVRAQQDHWLSQRANGSPLSGVKVVLYAEDHQLPRGTRRLEDGVSTKVLPAESGTKIGAEFGTWTADGYFKGSFANLFLTHASGLAAYGEFGVPTGVNINETSEGASSTMLALSGDIETPHFGVLLGAYYKYFQDADRESVDFDDYWESIFAARMHSYIGDHIQPGLELSYQVRQPKGPFLGTNSYEVPSVFKFSLIQAFSLGRGMYTRPQLRLMYTMSMLNPSAVNLIPKGDPRRDQGAQNGLTQHYLGVMVEWWFNNASLFRP